MNGIFNTNINYNKSIEMKKSIVSILADIRICDAKKILESVIRDLDIISKVPNYSTEEKIQERIEQNN